MGRRRRRAPPRHRPRRSPPPRSHRGPPRRGAAGLRWDRRPVGVRRRPAHLDQRDPRAPWASSPAQCSKTFTALCICALIEDGRLALSTSVTDVLSAALPHVSREVTIESLLTHTSGIGDYYDEDLVDDFTAYHLPIPWYRLERTARLPAAPRRAAAEVLGPASGSATRNSGFILLGLVVEERRRHSPTSECVQTRVFDTGRDVRTRASSASTRSPNSTALGYIDAEDGSWRTNVYNLPVVGGPDGGAFSTAPDIARFWSALDRRSHRRARLPGALPPAARDRTPTAGASSMASACGAQLGQPPDGLRHC